MNLRINLTWLLMGICMYGALNVESFGDEKYKIIRRNKSLPIFKRHSQLNSNFSEFSNFFSDFGDELDELLVDVSHPSKSVSLKKQNNDTTLNAKTEKILASKLYKKLPLRSCKSDEKSHTKRDNFFFRLFSDNYKPLKQRSILKKRDGNGYIRKVEMKNDTFHPSISYSMIPLTHFGRERKNDDKVCKTQIIKFLPKSIRKSFESNYNIVNETHKTLLGDNEWELRQDIYVEEILPFREKNELGFKNIFHDDTKKIVDEIFDIFTIFPFQFFDTIYIKKSTTEKLNLITSDYDENSEYEDTTKSDMRNKRQINTSAPETLHSLTHSSETVPTDQLKVEGKVDEIPNKIVTEVSTPSKVTNVTDSTTVITRVENNQLETNSTLKTNTTAVLTSPLSENNDSSVNTYEKDELVKNTSSTIPNTQHSAEKSTALPAQNTTERKHASVQQVLDQTTVNEMAKQKLLKENDLELLDQPENVESDVDRFSEKVLKNVVDDEEKETDGDKNAFLMVLGIIPGLIGLIIAVGVVGVVGIWMIQKNSTWVDRNNQGAEPTTSSQGKPVLTCSI